jgi:hypothetical protein
MKIKRYLVQVWLLWAVILLPAVVQAQFRFTTNNGAITITGYYDYSMEVAVIPSSINGYPVLSIGSRAFYDSNIKKAVIPDSITNIGDYAFSLCYSLTNINIPSGLTSIGDHVFSSCNLTNVIIPTNITSIGAFAFASIPQQIFTIPYSVTNIGDGAFYGGYTYSINTDTNNLFYSSINGVLFDKTKRILVQYPCGRTSVSPYGYEYYGSYKVPNSVLTIGNHAFYFCSYLTNITIPFGCLNIGNYCFCGCNSLTIITNSQNSFTVPANVTNIGTGSFANCTSLKTITVDPQNLYYCDLSGVLFTKDQTAIIQYPAGIGGAYLITNSVITVAQSAFSGCGGLNAITIPESVLNIGYGAFNSCGLINVTIPNSVTNVEPWAFSWCTRLTNFTFGTNLTLIRTNQFYHCTSLKTILIPNSIRNIEDNAFDGSGLITVTIPESVTNIGFFAFIYTPLTNAIIYNGVINIKDYAFYCIDPTGYNLPSLISIYFEGNAPNADPSALYYDSKATVYYMPNTSGWGTNYCSRPTMPAMKYYTNNNAITISGYIGPFSDLRIPNEISGFPVTRVANSAFMNNSILQYVAIPTTVTNIGSSSFYGCIGITNIIVPDSVNFIGDGAFSYCSNLVSATISDSVAAIGNNLFYRCASLGKIHIPDAVTSIGSSAFYACSSLTNIFIPCGVTNIGDSAFRSCVHLQGIYFCGNAPNATFLTFFGSTPKMYYLPGASGWTNSYQGLNTVLWNPQSQCNDGSFGIQSNQFGFNIAGNSNIVVVVNVCTNLSNPVWTPVQTLTLTNGTAYFSDLQWTNYPSKFYGFCFPQ